MNARSLAVTAQLASASAASAATALYREHGDFVWRNARRLGCADEWVDDAVQEVFLVAVRRCGELGEESNVRGWLFAITFRVVQRMQRDRSRYRARLSRYVEAQVEAPTASPEGASHAARELRELLAELDDVKRVVVILVELEGMTSAEVSRLLGVPQGTVDTRLRAARKQLQDALQRQRATEKGVIP